MYESTPTPAAHRRRHDGKKRVSRYSEHLHTIGHRVYPTLAKYTAARNVQMFLGSLHPPVIALGRHVRRTSSEGIAGMSPPRIHSARRGRDGTREVVVAASESGGGEGMCGGSLDGDEEGDESDEEDGRSGVGAGGSESADEMGDVCVEWFEEDDESDEEGGESDVEAGADGTRDMCVKHAGENESDIEAGGSWSAGSNQFLVYGDGFRKRYGEGRRRDMPSLNEGRRVFMECVMITK